jgi:hypothetical protein
MNWQGLVICDNCVELIMIEKLKQNAEMRARLIAKLSGLI